MRIRIGCLLLFALACCVQAQTQARLAERKTLDLGNGIKMEFVLIRPGSFMMGSTKGEGREQPVHKVTISRPFYIGQYEVTHEQWKQVMGSDFNGSKGGNNVAESTVTWDECCDFLAKLKGKASGMNVRLPTEAEWEYACRAGSTNEFCYGDDESGLGEYAWFSGNSGGATHAVGEKKPNAWGLYDMHGNVWEWCSDWFGAYGSKPPADSGRKGSLGVARHPKNAPTAPVIGIPVTDPVGPASGAARVCRGGSWSNGEGRGRSAYRNCCSLGERFDNNGLRVVMAGH